MPKSTIIKTSELETKYNAKLAALTLFCHQGGIDIQNDRDDIFEITPEKTVRHATTMPEGYWELWQENEDFRECWHLVFEDYEFPDDIVECSTDIQHITGLILLTMNTLICKKKPLWKLPETYLHPRHQAGLGSLAAYWVCLLYTSPSPRDQRGSRMPSSA